MKHDFCSYFVKIRGELSKAPNSVCWAAMYYQYGNTDGHLYISHYLDEDTSIFVTRLCNIINRVTPCKRVKIKGKEYIKFKLFPDAYNKNMLFLSFIRYLWYVPIMVNKRKERQLTFFHKLYTREYTDPISILTNANKEMCKDNMYGCGHSCIDDYNQMYVQDTASFEKYAWGKTSLGGGTREFLRQKPE